MKSKMCEFCYNNAKEHFNGMPLCEKHIHILKFNLRDSKLNHFEIERTRKALRVLCKAFDCSLSELGGYLLWKSGKYDVREYVMGMKKKMKKSK